MKNLIQLLALCLVLMIIMPPLQGQDESGASAQQPQDDRRTANNASSDAGAAPTTDQSETNDAGAAAKAVQDAMAEEQAKTPDPDVMSEAEYQQRMKELDAESKTDSEIVREKILDQAMDPSNGMELRDKLETGAVDAAEAAKAALDASTPSYTAGPSKDMIPLSTDEQRRIEFQMDAYQAAQQKREQATRNLTWYLSTHPAKLKPPPPAGPQIQTCSSDSACGVH